MTGIDITGCGDDDECAQALKAMYLYLDKEISEIDRSQVQIHLEECIHCVSSFQFEIEIKRLISTKCREEVPPQLYERIKATLLTEIQKSEGQL